MYVVAEMLFPHFDFTMNAVVRRAGLRKKCLKIGPLKDPVRIYEKVSLSVTMRPSVSFCQILHSVLARTAQAMDDYTSRFGDGVPPEACITDMLRCLALCSNGPRMLALLLLLSRDGGFRVTTSNGVKVHLELIETKNKFSPKKLSPTHFRNALLKLLLRANGTSMFVELQVHHVDIKQTVLACVFGC